MSRVPTVEVFNRLATWRFNMVEDELPERHRPRESSPDGSPPRDLGLMPTPSQSNALGAVLL